VLHSWVNAAELFQCELTIAVPDEYWPEKDLMLDIEKAGKWVRLIEDPREAAENADLIIADTWVSMGDTDAAERRRVLKPYQVNTNLMALADKNALFMHDLPAHRGDEVTDEVIDGPQSVVWDEAENRLHAQKAILCWAFGIETNYTASIFWLERPANGEFLRFRCSRTLVRCAPVLETHHFRLAPTRSSSQFRCFMPTSHRPISLRDGAMAVNGPAYRKYFDS
jgi:hypothetical protein